MTDDKNIDYYSMHLAALNHSNPVEVCRDIKNEQGMQLVAKGHKLTSNKAELLIKHRLACPLETSVSLSNSLDGIGLYKLLRKFIDKIPGLAAVTESERYQARLKHLCLRYAKFPLIQQKLTVLESQLPQVYFHSLFSAVAGITIAMEMDLPDSDIETVFLAGLTHNTGYLHLDPSLIENELELETTEDFSVQVHPKIGKLFLDMVPGLPKSVGKAVEDHHERADGTGYPNRKFGSSLEYTSQIIAITNLISRGYDQTKQYGEHAHQLILLILQLNDNVHSEEVYKAAAGLIQKGPISNAPPQNPPSAQQVLENRNRILQLFDAQKKLSLVLMTNTRTTLVRSIASMVGRLASSIATSGMMQDEYKDWLEEMMESTETSEQLTLLKSHIMQNEIDAQLARLTSLLEKAIHTIADQEASLKQSALASFEQINAL